MFGSCWPFFSVMKLELKKFGQVYAVFILFQLHEIEGECYCAALEFKELKIYF